MANDEVRNVDTVIPPRFIDTAQTQMRVFGAIMLREMMTRYGRENLGFFWLMGEPLILTTLVMITWSILNHDRNNVSIVSFVLTGYSMLTLWRHIISASIRIFRSNAGLLFHRNIHFVDTLLARTLLETTGIGISFTIAYITLYLLGLIGPINDILVLVGAWLLMAWFAFSVGLIIAGLTEIFEVVERFVQPIMYVTLPISGAFFLVEWLPLDVQKLAGYSVLVNLFEMFRGGLLGDKVIFTHWDVYYVVGWSILLTAIGITIAERARASIRFD
jgi:capsular polysaccharide transport system permease protein